jgi:hypothetical protein
MAFKVVMRKLQHHARRPELMAELFAPTTDVTFSLAAPDIPRFQTGKPGGFAPKDSQG